MCLGIFKKKPKPEPLYPNELSPKLTQQQVIEELEYDIVIHEDYAVWVVQNPSRYNPKVYGDYDWHIRWIEVYKAAIYYIQRADSTIPAYDRLSTYARRTDL